MELQSSYIFISRADSSLTKDEKGNYSIVLGNSIYMKYIENKANQAKAMGEPNKSYFITTNAGVNSTAAIIAVIGRIIIGFILL
jgi:hypothetical protein